MTTYLSVKSVLVAVCVLTAFSLFYLRVRRLGRIMRAVSGKSDQRLDRIPERLKVLLVDVLGQTNVRRKLLPGVAHTLIFFGFLAVQPHSLELMIRGVFPGFQVGDTIPGIYGAYLSVADILAFLALFGVGYALYRRVIVKPVYLTNGLDARLILAFTAVIVVSFHVINAFLIVLPESNHGFDYARYLSVSAAVASLFNLSALSTSGRLIGFEMTYWIHVLTILLFLVYIPGSKHLHLLAAVPNVFLKPLERPKSIVKTDLDDEHAQSFGLGRVSEFSWKRVLDLYACTECGRCEEQCPADMTGKPLSPKRVVHDAKQDLFGQAETLLDGNMAAILPLVREDSPITGDVLWACTTCRACENICPVNIQHLDIILEARKYQVLMESSFPPEMQNTFVNLENQSNPWGFGSDSRADWCKGMGVRRMTDHPAAELLYFVGCAGSFDDRGKQIARALTRVLQKAGVNFAILGEEERCNGDPARRAGNEYLAQMMIQENVAALAQYRPKRILAGCPHCYNILKNEYPQFGASYDVLHHSELLLELVRQGRLKIRPDSIESLVYHDSCYLGRWNGLFEAPRQLLQELCGRQRILDPARSRDKGLCCGAGGARIFMEETIGRRINHERTREIIETGASTVAAACPFCVTMLRDGIADANGSMSVLDIAEIVDAVTEG
jgi:Fe-S oxidoreductase